MIKCDVCGKNNVQETILDPPKEAVWGMKEYSERPQFTIINAVMIYHRYALTCLDCGHRIEYTR